MPPLTLKHLNTCSAAEFVGHLGAIYEHSPWVAEAACQRRPFASLDALQQAMAQAVLDASEGAQLALIRAHPELAGKAALRGELTAASTREQSGAGLSQCSAQEYATLQTLNDAYNAKFSFPFIIAVRGHDRRSIIRHFSERLQSDYATELRECLHQINRIAGFRLGDLIAA